MDIGGCVMDKEDVVLVYCVLTLCVGYAGFVYWCKALVYFAS